ncbi:hypothetical protein, partial [Gilliamella sp. BG6]|uniref:hypothetical protein n=1 Tax=unclassified Gilliamella TaxID=2685620 RepID=UPI00398770B9
MSRLLIRPKKTNKRSEHGSCSKSYATIAVKPSMDLRISVGPQIRMTGRDSLDPRQNIRQCPPLSFFRFGNIVVHIV